MSASCAKASCNSGNRSGGYSNGVADDRYGPRSICARFVANGMADFPILQPGQTQLQLRSVFSASGESSLPLCRHGGRIIASLFMDGVNALPIFSNEAEAVP